MLAGIVTIVPILHMRKPRLESLPKVTQQAVKGRVGIWIPSALCLFRGPRIMSSAWVSAQWMPWLCVRDTGPLPLWVSVSSPVRSG